MIHKGFNNEEGGEEDDRLEDGEGVTEKKENEAQFELKQ